MNHCIISNDQLQKLQSIPLRGHETLKHIFADLNRLQIGEYLCMSLDSEHFSALFMRENPFHYTLTAQKFGLWYY